MKLKCAMQFKNTHPHLTAAPRNVFPHSPRPGCQTSLIHYRVYGLVYHRLLPNIC